MEDRFNITGSITGLVNGSFITVSVTYRDDCMRMVHTPPLWGVKKGMYPETNTLPKQPYPVRSAAGLVDLIRIFSARNAVSEEIRGYYEILESIIR